MDTGLVAVDSLAALQRAYPNYFADTRVFLELLKQADVAGDAGSLLATFFATHG